MSPLELLTPFLAGLAGTLHCAGMCGPLAAAAGAAGGKRVGAPLFLLGKTASYLFLGTLLATGGALAARISTPQLLWLARLAAGAWFLILGVGALAPEWLPAGKAIRSWVPRFMAPLAKALQGAGPASSLGLGAVAGLLPCPLSWGMAAWAAGTGDPLRGGALMVAFGLGTAPGLAAVAYSAAAARGARGPALRVAAGLAWSALGLWLLLSPPGAACH